MRASFCSTQIPDEELIPAPRNGSCNCLPGEQDSCDFTTILVALFTLLKISMLVLVSASEHGKNSLQTVNHLWGCVQREKLFFSKYSCWIFYHQDLWGKELESNDDIFYQVCYSCGKSTWIQAGYNEWLRDLHLQTLSQFTLLTTFTVPVLWTTLVVGSPALHHSWVICAI